MLCDARGHSTIHDFFYTFLGKSGLEQLKGRINVNVVISADMLQCSQTHLSIRRRTTYLYALA